MKPDNLVGLSPTERAYFESGGTIHPETGKPAEEPSAEAEQAETATATQPVGIEQPSATDDTEAEEGQPEEGSEEADGEEDVIEVADGTNPDGTRRRTVISFKAFDKERM